MSKRAVKAEPDEKIASTAVAKRKQRLSQSDVPAYSIKEALRVPTALRDEYGKQPTRPLMVAKAMSMTPTGGTFRSITGAAVAYGLTDAAAQGEVIGLTSLGKRAVAPTAEGDDLGALREAVLQPQVVRQFLEKYDGSKIPSRSIALNVLEDYGVPADATNRAYDMILENAEFVGYLQQISGQNYVNLEQSTVRAAEPELEPLTSDDDSTLSSTPQLSPAKIIQAETPPASMSPNNIATNKRVFISHGKNSEIVAQLKEVLTFGGFEPVVSIENETVSKPVPDKVLDDMRSCGAGIVHVGAENKFIDQEGHPIKVLNENVLIEIGGAMALYRRNFILLVERGITLPSNLQGLYEVRYEGDKLDYESTMKLLKAFNDFKLASYES